jgi:hypothetical protein
LWWASAPGSVRRRSASNASCGSRRRRLPDHDQRPGPGVGRRVSATAPDGDLPGPRQCPAADLLGGLEAQRRPPQRDPLQPVDPPTVLWPRVGDVPRPGLPSPHHGGFRPCGRIHAESPEKRFLVGGVQTAGTQAGPVGEGSATAECASWSDRQAEAQGLTSARAGIDCTPSQARPNAAGPTRTTLDRSGFAPAKALIAEPSAPLRMPHGRPNGRATGRFRMSPSCADVGRR